MVSTAIYVFTAAYFITGIIKWVVIWKIISAVAKSEKEDKKKDTWYTMKEE